MIVCVRPLWGLALRASVPGSANDRSGRWRGRWVNHHGPCDLFSECRSVALSPVVRLPLGPLLNPLTIRPCPGGWAG